MDALKREKSKSFWGGILTGAAVAGVVLTIVACILLFSQASYFNELNSGTNQ